ncbi:hypothetical protein [Brevifollis gellanilyticus]|uniref:T6SS immunity protein Tdi1 C-terminal domain-containing protein n=1 Tax=Brevifollis gellanilyticus TaxID=748831 RepID=A0A512M708_9BACT|nr:hypothetical protein [Brevifollis gellanilyticus]GEP42526.1 hypothetical protein BGE01nite_18170 [Brevifollis gellanilyticus]
MFFIQPSAQDIQRALDSWLWLPLADKAVIRVTAFGDFFLQNDEGIWFLDTLEGKISLVCQSIAQLNELLGTEDGQDHYLFGGFVERAVREGRLLGQGQCYDFKVNPVVGGSISYDNIGIRSFVVAVNLAGQLHDKVRHLPEGTIITGFNISD